MDNQQHRAESSDREKTDRETHTDGKNKAGRKGEREQASAPALCPYAAPHAPSPPQEPTSNLRPTRRLSIIRMTQRLRLLLLIYRY